VYHTHPLPTKSPHELKKVWQSTGQFEKCTKLFKTIKSAAPPQLGPKSNLTTTAALLSSFRPTSKGADFKSVSAVLCEVSSAPFQKILHHQVEYAEVQDIRRLLAVWIPVLTTHTFPEKGHDGKTLWRFWDRLDQDQTTGAGIAISASGETQRIANLSKQKHEDEQYLEKLYSGLINEPRVSAIGVGEGGKNVPDPIIARYARDYVEVGSAFLQLVGFCP